MAEAAEENQDQSMEEILQSIKRIIADEDEEGAETLNVEHDSDSASDVLELTELVQEDGTVTNLDEGTAMPVADSAPLEAAEAFSTSRSAEDGGRGLVSDAAAEASASALSSLKQKEKPKPAPLPKIDSPSFRSGVTVEDLVMESLKPMLSQWLDANLPGIVEHLVEKEIKRISDK